MPDLDQASCSRQRCQRSPCSRQPRSASLASQRHHPRDLLHRAAAVGAPATGPQWASLLWPQATLLLHLALPLRHLETTWMCLDRRLLLGGWGRSHSGQSPQQPYLLQGECKPLSLAHFWSVSPLPYPVLYLSIIPIMGLVWDTLVAPLGEEFWPHIGRASSLGWMGFAAGILPGASGVSSPSPEFCEGSPCTRNEGKGKEQRSRQRSL